MNIFHGKVISLDDQDRIYQYLVEDQGRIVYLGDDLPPEYKNGKSQIELGDQVLIPAFGDGHLHFSSWAMFAASYFDVREAKDIPEIQDMTRNFIDKNHKLKVIIAFGVSKHTVEEKRLITRTELDQVCPEIPMLLICYDGHSAVFNSRLLELFPDNVKELPGYYPDEGHLFNEAYFEGTDFAVSLVPPP